MADQLSAKDWLDQGLRKLAESGYTALKAEPLAKAMGVSRGSFYWHFADIGAFHAAILKHWHEVAAERIIATGEAACAGERGAQLGRGRARGQGRGAGDRPAPAGLRGKPARGRRAFARGGAGAGANSLLGVSRLCAIGQTLAAGATAGDAGRNAADGGALGFGGN